MAMNATIKITKTIASPAMPALLSAITS